MNDIKLSQRSLLSLKKHALWVTFICYIPHIATEPIWLFILFLAAIVYRLIADYYSYALLPLWARLILVLGCLFLLYGSSHSSGFFIRFLLAFIILKCLEFHSIRDLKVLVLCNFLLIFAALLVIQEIWILLYLFIAIIANLSIMLKLNTSEVTLRQISGKSTQQLLIAIPLGFLLFYVFPRIDPLWHIRTPAKGTTGFAETMTFGSIAEVFFDDSLVMQITFKGNPIVNGYWRGVILSSYDGESWNSSSYNSLSFSPLQELNENEIADYEILLEPNQTKWLFYEGLPGAARPNLLFSPDHGLIRQNIETIGQRFAYSIKVKPAQYVMLNSVIYNQEIEWPPNSNPRLNAWSKEQFAKTNKNVQAFIHFLHQYIYQYPFWYTLTVPNIPSGRNQMDSFWFDTQKGFCEYYASAVTLILRAVGIPARVVVGYHGGEWNPITHSIAIHQNNAHAWVEYWQEGVGWQQLDPTSFISPERIDQTIRTGQTDNLDLENYFDFSELPWHDKIKFIFESARFYSERWFLFYNRNTQQNLLQNIGLGQWNQGQLLQASVGSMVLFFIFIAIYYQWRQKQTLDSLLLEYHLLQKEFRKFNVSTHPPVTLIQQCKSIIMKAPNLNPILSSFIERYEELRLKQGSNENQKETIALFKKLRYTLRKACKQRALR